MQVAKLLAPALIVIVGAFLAISVSGQVLLPSEGTDSGLGGTNSITGKIRVESGRLERRINVRLQTPMRGDRVTTTDEYGNFLFRGLVSGDYVIVIDKESDFEPLTQAVSIIQMRGFPSVNQTLQIRLIPKASAAAKPAVINVELAGVPETAVTMYRKAAELGNAGDHKGAIEQLNKAIAEYSKFTLAYNDLGVQYLKLEDLGRADDAFKSALNIDSKCFSALLNHGIVLFTIKKYAAAELVFRDVVNAKEGFATGHYFLGQSLAYLGKFPDAQKELTVAITLGGEAMAVAMKEAHRLLAVIYSTQGDKKHQAEELEIYLRLAPTAPDAEQLRKVLTQLKG